MTKYVRANPPKMQVPPWKRRGQQLQNGLPAAVTTAGDASSLPSLVNDAPTSLGSSVQLSQKTETRNIRITIGIDEITGEPITVSQIDLCSGGYLLGMQGVGKTSALIALAVQQLCIGGSVFVIDPTMDMINAIIARMPEDRVNDTYLLDLTSYKFPFDLNIFNSVNKQGLEAYVTVLRQSMKAFEKLWSEVSTQVNFSNVLYPVIETILAVPELSLAHTKRLLLDDNFRHQCITRLQNTDADLETLNFWEEYDNLSNSDRKDLTRAFLGRLTKLLRDPYVKYIICQNDTPKDNKNVDLREAILKGRNIFVYLPITERSAYEDASKFVGTFFMMQFYEAIFSFRKGKRPGCMFIVDEFENYAFAGKDFEGIYSKARKYGCKLILAHQHRGQLNEESMKIIRDATTGANIILCFKTNDKDPGDMARLFSGYTYYDEDAANEPFWDEDLYNTNTETDQDIYGDEEWDEGDEEYTRKPTAIYIDPHKHLGDAKNPPIIKEFYARYVCRLEEAASMRIMTEKVTDKSGNKSERTVYPIKHFGIGIPLQFDPAEALGVLELLDILLYTSQRDGRVNEELLHQFVNRYAKLTGVTHTETVKDETIQQQLDELEKQWKMTDFKWRVVIGMLEKEKQEIENQHYGSRNRPGPEPDWSGLQKRYNQLGQEELPNAQSGLGKASSTYSSQRTKLERQLLQTIEVGDTTVIEQILTPVLYELIAHPLAADTTEIERERKQLEQERIRTRERREQERARALQKQEQEKEKREREQRKREWEREQNAHKTLTASQLGELLPKLPNQHAFVKIRGGEIHRMRTIDLNEYYPAVSSDILNERKGHIINQTKDTYCRGRKTVAAQINAVYSSIQSETPDEDALPDPRPPKQKALPSGETGMIKRQRVDIIEE